MKKMQLLAVSTMTLFLAMNLPVLAGNINSYEAALIEEASGTFEYGGKLYKAKEQYLSQLRAKFSEDDVDLTEEQAAELRAMMYDSVAEGVSEGILAVQENIQTEPEQEETDGSSSVIDEEKRFISGQEEEESSDSTAMTDDPGGEKTGTAVNKNDLENSQVSSESAEPEVTEKAAETKEESTSVKSNAADQEMEGDSESREASPASEVSGKEADRTFASSRLAKTNHSILPVAAAVILAILATASVLYRQIRKKKIRILAEQIKTLTEVHCHILPHVDDGAKDLEMALKMIEEEYQQGVRRIIATPHYHIGYYKKEFSELCTVFEKLKERAKENYPDLELALGNEIFYSAGVLQHLEEGKAGTLAGTRYVLVEFRTDDSWRHIQEALTTLLRARYIPVVAHVERYRNVIGDKAHMEEMGQMGVLLQMNFSSVKHYRRWIKEGYIDLFGTDCHNLLDRSPKIRENILELAKICPEDQLRRMLVENPEKIWNQRRF